MVTSRADESVSDRIVTVPNVLSVLRLAGVPLFLGLVLERRLGSALLVLAASGATDYLDGAIARRTHTVTRLGQVLDPAADRLFILSTLVGLVVLDAMPWWFAGALLVRDAGAAAVVAMVRRRGYRALPVHFVGKLATFALLCAFPLLLLARWRADWAAAVSPVAWAFAWWGLALYWVGLGMYVVHARGLPAPPDPADALAAPPAA